MYIKVCFFSKCYMLLLMCICFSCRHDEMYEDVKRMNRSCSCCCHKYATLCNYVHFIIIIIVVVVVVVVIVVVVVFDSNNGRKERMAQRSKDASNSKLMSINVAQIAFETKRNSIKLGKIIDTNKCNSAIFLIDVFFETETNWKRERKK
jgi:hypothetical protein